MYIGHYKAVGSANEFFSEKKKRIRFSNSSFLQKGKILFICYAYGRYRRAAKKSNQ